MGGISLGGTGARKTGVHVMTLRDDDLFQDSDVTDPLRIERSHLMADEEAAAAEALCLAATPGPLMVDDATEGEGILVATLPDGRSIVSLACEARQVDADRMADANLQLFCRARYLLLRMLRDRGHLLDRIRDLEESLEAGQSEKAPALPR